MERIRYKNTVYVKFKPQILFGDNWVAVVPDNYSAYLETASVKPEQLVELKNITTPGDNFYYVKFHADETTYEKLRPGDRYYIAFYWEKDGVKTAERILIEVIPD